MNSAQKFKEFVASQCVKYNIEFQFTKKPYVGTDIGVKCNGFFDETVGILAVAGGQSEERWLKILVHEYSHMTQWIAQTKIWKDATDATDAEDITELWYDGKIELSKAQLNHWIGLARNVEWEAEKRVLKLIKKHKLPINPTDYIKRANAYLYFWTFTGIVRRWYEIGKEPYNIEKIVSIMPETLDQDYSKLPKKIEKLYRRYC